MLYVVRHGRTAANASGLLLGHLDPDLDDLGVRQARLLAAALGPVDRVVSSPLARTRQTAEAFGIEVDVDDRWIEMNYGEFDGRPMAEVPAETWAVWRADLDWAPPGGESHRDLGIRVRAAMEDLFDASRTSDVAVVTHVSPVKAALAWTLGVGDELAWRTYVAPASVMVVGAGPAGPSLRNFNDIAHLAEG